MHTPDLNVALHPPEAVLHMLGSRREGLAEAEVRHRLQEIGPNRVEAAVKAPLWLTLLREFCHFFALIPWLPPGCSLRVR